MYTSDIDLQTEFSSEALPCELWSS